MAMPIRNIVIVGAGLMGCGIAQVCVQANYEVILVDCTAEILARARGRITSSLQRMHKDLGHEERGKIIDDIQERLKCSTNVEAAVREADLVIEAIVENLEAKRTIMAKIENGTKGKTILATNTSSLRLADISRDLNRKHNFGGLHFFNPVPKMKLLEVITTPNTSGETLASLLEFGRSIEKTTVVCKDTPGFIANRILIPIQCEALGIVDRGEASPEDVDLACRAGLGFPIGPFALLDFIGLGWMEHYPGELNVKQSPKLDELVSAGKLGRKTGEGFYKYKSNI